MTECCVTNLLELQRSALRISRCRSSKRLSRASCSSSYRGWGSIGVSSSRMSTSWASRSAAPTQPVQARSVVQRVVTGSPAPSLRSQQPPSCIDAHEVMILSTVPHWLSPSVPNAPRDGADGGQPDHKHVEFTPLLGAEQRQQRNEDTPQHRVCAVNLTRQGCMRVSA